MGLSTADRGRLLLTCLFSRPRLLSGAQQLRLHGCTPALQLTRIQGPSTGTGVLLICSR